MHYGRGSAPIPTGGAYSAPPDPVAVGEALPPPQEPRPAPGLQPLISALRASGVHPQDKFLATPLHG